MLFSAQLSDIIQSNFSALPMRYIKQNVSDDEVHNRLLAHIYVQDELAVSELRKFLESNSITVIFNPAVVESADYCFVFGDYEFVKSIVSILNNYKRNIYLIITDVTLNQYNFLEKLSGKLIIYDKKLLDYMDIQKIGRFIFTSQSKVLKIASLLPDLSTSTENLPTANSDFGAAYQTSHEKASLPIREFKHLEFTEDKLVPVVDLERINTTISEIFNSGKKEIPKSNITRKTDLRFVFLIVIFSPILFILIFKLSVFCAAYTSVKSLMSDSNTFQNRIFFSASKIFRSTGTSIYDIIEAPYIYYMPASARIDENILKITEISNSLKPTIIDTEFKLNSVFETLTSNLKGKSQDNVLAARNIEIVKSNILQILVDVQRIKTLLGQIKNSKSRIFSINYFKTMLDKTEKNLDDYLSYLNKAYGLMQIFGKISGFDGKKTLLVLFQNSMELRPTGGFIGSLAEITLLDGSIYTMDIKDVYSVDGQLKGHVDPPPAISGILGNEHWYLRDSNWDPDFPVSGSTAIWFYEKEIGIKADGVIAVNSGVLLTLIDLYGPLKLDDYNDTITADNFYGKALYYIHSGFFPGSSQKKDFLGSIFSTLINIMYTDQGPDKTKLVRNISNSIKSKDIMLYFSDPQIQSAVVAYNMGGVYPPVNICSTRLNENCYSDLIGSVDANLSVSKVNYFIKKTQSAMINFDKDGNISYQLTNLYKNTSTESITGQSGIYRNYSRWYLPADSEVENIILNGKSVEIITSDEINNSLVPFAKISKLNNGLIELAVVFDTDIKSESKVTLSYIRRNIISNAKHDFTYRLSIPKQSGNKTDAYDISLTLPYGWSTVTNDTDITSGQLANSNSLRYNINLSEDEMIIIKIQKQGDL